MAGALMDFLKQWWQKMLFSGDIVAVNGFPVILHRNSRKAIFLAGSNHFFRFFHVALDRLASLYGIDGGSELRKLADFSVSVISASSALAFSSACCQLCV